MKWVNDGYQVAQSSFYFSVALPGPPPSPPRQILVQHSMEQRCQGTSHPTQIPGHTPRAQWRHHPDTCYPSGIPLWAPVGPGYTGYWYVFLDEAIGTCARGCNPNSCGSWGHGYQSCPHWSSSFWHARGRLRRVHMQQPMAAWMVSQSIQSMVAEKDRQSIEPDTQLSSVWRPRWPLTHLVGLTRSTSTDHWCTTALLLCGGYTS